MNINEIDTHLVYLIDRSGSMRGCWTDTIGGLNSDIVSQKAKDDGKTMVTVTFFDLYRGETCLEKAFVGALTECPEFSDQGSNIRPRGSTPLHDSAGLLITEVRESIMELDPKPMVLMSIFTDGYNNHNRGYSSDDVKRMVEICEEEGWTFTYFGANQDAWAASSSFGISKGNTVQYDTSNMAQTMAMASTARSSFIAEAKMARSINPAAMYKTKTFFEDAGQSAEDYA